MRLWEDQSTYNMNWVFWKHKILKEIHNIILTSWEWQSPQSQYPCVFSRVLSIIRWFCSRRTSVRWTTLRIWNFICYGLIVVLPFASGNLNISPANVLLISLKSKINLKRICQNTVCFPSEFIILADKKNINYVQTMDERHNISFWAIKWKATKSDNRERRWLANIGVRRTLVHQPLPFQTHFTPITNIPVSTFTPINPQKKHSWQSPVSTNSKNLHYSTLYNIDV